MCVPCWAPHQGCSSSCVERPGIFSGSDQGLRSSVAHRGLRILRQVAPGELAQIGECLFHSCSTALGPNIPAASDKHIAFLLDYTPKLTCRHFRSPFGGPRPTMSSLALGAMQISCQETANPAYSFTIMSIKCVTYSSRCGGLP